MATKDIIRDEVHPPQLVHDAKADPASEKGANILQTVCPGDGNAGSERGSTPQDGPVQFSYPRQMWRILWPQLLRWIGTVILTGLWAMSVSIWAARGAFPTWQKSGFQANTALFSVLLSLNFFDGVKQWAAVYRWRLLTFRNTIKDAITLLDFTSMFQVISLIFRASTHLNQRFIAIFTVLNFLSNQVVIITTDFSYAVDDSQFSNETYTRPGEVDVPLMADYCDPADGSCLDSDEIREARAHSYGEALYGARCSEYDDISDILESTEDVHYFCKRQPGQQEFAYRLKEYNPEDEKGSYPYWTDSIITASSGPCLNYSLPALPEITTDRQTNVTSWRYSFSNGTFDGSMEIPAAPADDNSTLYIYRDSEAPRDAKRWSCGPRCMWIWALRDAESLASSALFQCPITVSSASNTSEDTAKEFPDHMARLVASAISLQGQDATENEMAAPAQFQHYPAGTALDITSAQPDQVGANMAEFAMASLASMATQNPRVSSYGSVPYLGSFVSVKWEFMVLHFCLIIGLHFFYVLYSLAISSFVIIGDDSAWTIARLLRPFVDEVGRSGPLLTGDAHLDRLLSKYRQADQDNGDGGIVGSSSEIRTDHATSQKKGKAKKVDIQVAYGPRKIPGDDDDLYELVIASDVEPGRFIPRKRHPPGRYI